MVRPWLKAWKFLERGVKAGGTLAALVAGLALVCDYISTRLDMLTAWRFGVKGYAYYEVGENRATTKDGQFYLTRDGPGRYQDIRPGDKLQGATTDSTSIRSQPTHASAQIFVVHKGECVVVLAKHHAVPVGLSYDADVSKLRDVDAKAADQARRANKPAPAPSPLPVRPVSGGWLRVATAACGLFR